MVGRDNCMYYYSRLLALLEEDYSTISKCVDGELKDAYKAALLREISALKEKMYALPTE